MIEVSCARYLNTRRKSSHLLSSMDTISDRTPVPPRNLCTPKFTYCVAFIKESNINTSFSSKFSLSSFILEDIIARFQPHHPHGNIQESSRQNNEDLHHPSRHCSPPGHHRLCPTRIRELRQGFILLRPQSHVRQGYSPHSEQSHPISSHHGLPLQASYSFPRHTDDTMKTRFSKLPKRLSNRRRALRDTAKAM